MLGSGKISKAGLQITRGKATGLKMLYRWWYPEEYATWRIATAVRDRFVKHGRVLQNGNGVWTIGGFTN